MKTKKGGRKKKGRKEKKKGEARRKKKSGRSGGKVFGEVWRRKKKQVRKYSRRNKGMNAVIFWV